MAILILLLSIISFLIIDRIRFYYEYKTDKNIIKLHELFLQEQKGLMCGIDPYNIVTRWAKKNIPENDILIGHNNYIATLEDDSDPDVFGFQLVFKIDKIKYSYTFFPEKSYSNTLKIERGSNGTWIESTKTKQSRSGKKRSCPAV